MENPAVVSPIPPKLKKDYDKLWTRFTLGKDDAKLVKDLDNLLKKQKGFDPALTLQAYIELYRGNEPLAAQKFEQVLSINPNHRIALYYLAEILYAHADYARASTLYSRLLAADKSRTDLEMKRQKAVLLSAENLLRAARRAEEENRLADAESLYRQALNILPNEPSLHIRFSELLTRAKKTDEAAAERKRAEELMPRAAEPANRNDEAKLTELEDLGRWGNDIEVFREIGSAASITRAQLAVLAVRYFPGVTEFRQTSQIVTDTQDSRERGEIQTVLGLGLIEPLPNRTFQPSAEITRGDLASALARLIRLLGLPLPEAPPVAVSDVASTNARYPEVQVALGYGLMKLEDSGGFGVAGPVSGREAIAAMERLLRSFQQLR